MTQPPRRTDAFPAKINMRAAFSGANGRLTAKVSLPQKFQAAGQGDNKLPVTTRLNWHILGGNNQHRIGANCGLCVYEETLADGRVQKRALLFDAGTLAGDPKCPEDPSLAECDTVIPDLTPYLRKKDGSADPETVIDSIYLTHSHGDHVGAIPFMILMGYEVPKIYGTPYTVKRLQQELLQAGVPPADWPPVYMIAPGKPIEEGPVKVTAFWVSHSTPQSVGFFIETPEGNILNPGDFKLDQSVVWGPAFSEAQFNRITAGKTVDLLLMDSTGADRDITPVTEADVRESLRQAMRENPGKRIIIAVMSGFEENLASAALVAAQEKRDLWIAGWSHEQALDALNQTGLTLRDQIGLPINVRTLAPGRAARDLAAQDPGQSVVIVTGAQGKPNAALTRAVDGTHNALTLDPQKDIVLFCAPSIPGQEAGRQRLFAMLRQKNIPFLTRQDRPLYAHAHARLPELRQMAKLANPSTLVPIHGDAALRQACADAMEQQGHRVLPVENGDVLRVSRKNGITVAAKSDEKPKLIGFKTLQGTNWQDRHYMMVRTQDAQRAANDDTRPKKPRIFDIGR